jgi:hypothetical protein
MFLMTTTLAGVTTAGLLGSAGRLTAGALDSAQSATLLRVVQDIYPHPKLLSLAHYQAIVDAVGADADDDEAKAAALTDGLARLDELSRTLYGTPYVEVEDPDTREGLLRAFQNEGFFQGVRWIAYFAIYDNKEVWPLFGYEGSSLEYGGYIDRGFSDITFVPQGPSLEERMAQVQQ